MLTVGIPVYNNRQGLEILLKSLSGKSPQYRVIIADNCSNDVTQYEFQGIKEKYPNFIFHRHKKNIGAARNFEFLLECADQKYFAWLAADDQITDNFFEACIQCLEEKPSLAAACMWSPINAHFSAESDGATSLQDDDPRSRILAYLRCFPDRNMRFYSVYRTDVIRRAYKGQLNYYAGDWALFTSVLSFGKTIVQRDDQNSYIKLPGGISERKYGLLKSRRVMMNYWAPTLALERSIPCQILHDPMIQSEISRIKSIVRGWHHYQAKLALMRR